MVKQDAFSTVKNSNLTAAKAAKNDEFYTQWVDVEREMNAYLEFNENIFRGKTILLPCDDPEWSNFTKYFALRFEELGIKKLISTSYAPSGSDRGKKFTLERKDINKDGRVDIADLQWEYLEGNGDFRSDEVTALRDSADMVVTNPPFSLFRDFVAWLNDSRVQYSILGNVNAVTAKDIFPLFQANKMWLGPTISSGDREFRVPDSYPLHAAGCRVDDSGNKYINVKGVRWFTNIEHGRRHQELELVSEEKNIRFGKKGVQGVGYSRYDNYDAIEVPFTSSIPSDYDGVMGVPITFLDKFNPDQFEILGISANGGLPEDVLIPGQPKYDRPYIAGKRMYSRIIIKRKKTTTKRKKAAA